MGQALMDVTIEKPETGKSIVNLKSSILPVLEIRSFSFGLILIFGD